MLSFDFGWRHRAGLHTKAIWDAEPAPDPHPGAAPDESKLDYAADDWAEVSLPHDGLIASAPSERACPGGCSGKSYLPRHVLWYRKQFTIPAEWRGDVFWLDFEGSFRNTTVWLNGVLVANHVCGYTCAPSAPLCLSMTLSTLCCSRSPLPSRTLPLRTFASLFRLTPSTPAHPRPPSPPAPTQPTRPLRGAPPAAASRPFAHASRPFRIRLDNLTAIRLGGSTNVLAVYVDPDNGDRGGRAHGSGWWCEGGGL